MAPTIVEPPWFRDLPRLREVSAPRFNRLPNSALTFPGTNGADDIRSLALALRHRCSECGCGIPPGPVYQVMTSQPEGMQDDKEHPGGVFTEPAPGPMHRSCAMFSTLICPFLKYPTSRRRFTDYKVTRGDAAIVGFRRHGIAFFTEPTMWETMWLFGYFDVAERIPYRTWKDILPLYDEAVAADAKVIDARSRLFWTERDSGHLIECARWDKVTLARLRATAYTRVGGYADRLALL